MEPVEPVQRNIYQSNTYQKDLSCLHFVNEPRVIGKSKKLYILQNIVSLTQIDLLDEIMVIVCAIINLNKSIVAT